MSLHRLYVWAPQAVAVRSMLDDCGLAFERHRLHVVNYPHHLHGLAKGTFAIVHNHSSPVPAEIMEVVTALGMVVLTLDDSLVLAKAGQHRAA